MEIYFIFESESINQPVFGHLIFFRQIRSYSPVRILSHQAGINKRDQVLVCGRICEEGINKTCLSDRPSVERNLDH